MNTKALLISSAIAMLIAPLNAQDTRELGAHEHGHGTLNVAVEGDQIALELEAPGFDIVGFEHPATSEQDKEAVYQALETLNDPGNLFTLPASAGCSVQAAEVALLGDDDHHGDDHDDGDTTEASHTEFHAEFLLTCIDIAAITTIELSYFAAFENAQELDVQLVTDTGAAALEVTAQAPTLDLMKAK